MNREIVPGMAEAIEARRRQLRLSLARFAELSGLTPQGLLPLRRGERRQYRERLKSGVCEALQWTDDSIDRLLAGERPVAKPPAVVRMPTTDEPPNVNGLLRMIVEVAESQAEMAERLAAVEQELAANRGRARTRRGPAPS